jgi:ubiquinone/menaquinone biosynthesis C-methylase UbiE
MADSFSSTGGGQLLETAKVWWVLLTQVGPLGSSGRYSDMWIRLFITEALEEEGFFEYLEEPRIYGQVIAHFGYVDSPYTREVFETLSSGKHRLLVKEGARYRRNPDVPLPSQPDVAKRTPAKFHGMTMLRDFARRIPARMREEPIDFVHRFEEEGPAVMSFDKTLTLRVYGALRMAALAYINVRELRGKRLLDVACGSGHETADIWLRVGGDIQITAVDPVPGLLNLAEKNFVEIINHSDHGGKVQLTDANRPAFHLMSAMDLDFPDESFDVVYHSLLLHWTPDPAKAIQEMMRVLRPGGLVFGTQITRPLASPYMNLINQVHENVYGYFWEEELRRWYERAGVTLSIATPAGIFKGRKVG